MFGTLLIRSQPFNEPGSLTVNFTVPLIFFLHFGGTGWLERTGYRYLPNSMSVNPDKTPVGKSLFKWFLPRAGFVKNRMLWCISEWLLCPSPCWKHEEIFTERIWQSSRR